MLQQNAKSFITGHSDKPETFNRVEFATKNLVRRIQNTDNYFNILTSKTPEVTIEDLWLYAISDMICNTKRPSASNDQLLSDLQNAEKQLGLSAQKIKRVLCSKNNQNLIKAILFGIITVASIASIAFTITFMGIKAAAPLMLITSAVIIGALSGFMILTNFNTYRRNIEKQKILDDQTRQFLNKKLGVLNEAQKFVIRRAEAINSGLSIHK